MINIDLRKIKYGQLSGYAEFFEWNEFPKDNSQILCRFVQFCPENPSKIQLAKNLNNLIGVTTISCGLVTNNPQEWPFKYYMNEFGDLCLEKKEIAIAEKKYDEVNELVYMSTKREESFLPAINENFQPDVKYITRFLRKEWIQVILMGQCIIEDDGNCKEGEYCTLYQGDDKTKYGIAVPAKKSDKVKFYVMGRICNNTIMCLLKNI